MRYALKITLTALILIAAVDSLRCAGIEIKTWETFEISLKSSVKFQNPYVDCLKKDEQPYLTAVLTCTEGACKGKTIRVPGFWDGGDIWKIRFALSDAGTWKYETFSVDRKMKGKKGELKVTEWSDEEKTINPVRHGFITVNNSGSRKGRYFTYTDGTTEWTVTEPDMSKTPPEVIHRITVDPGPTVTTQYWITSVTDRYGTNAVPSERTTQQINPLPAPSNIYHN